MASPSSATRHVLTPVQAVLVHVSIPPVMNAAWRIPRDPHRMCNHPETEDPGGPCIGTSISSLPSGLMSTTTGILTRIPHRSRAKSIATLPVSDSTLSDPSSKVIGPNTAPLSGASTSLVPGLPPLTTDLPGHSSPTLASSPSDHTPTITGNEVPAPLIDHLTPIPVLVTALPPASTLFTENATLSSSMSITSVTPESTSRARLSSQTRAGIGIGVSSVVAICIVSAAVSWIKRRRCKTSGPLLANHPFVEMPESEISQLRPPAATITDASLVTTIAPVTRRVTRRDSILKATITRLNEKQLLDNGGFALGLPGGTDTSTQTKAAFDGGLGVVTGCQHRIDQRGGVRKETDGGVRLAGGRPGEVVYEFDGPIESDCASEFDGSECTLPPSYCSDFGHETF